MLADILRLSGKPAAALTEYDVSLKTDPGRLMSLLHAQEIAHQLHLDKEERTFALQIAHNTTNADPAVKTKIGQIKAPAARTALLD